MLGIMKFSGLEISAATSEFDIPKMIGEGGYGSVYKGKLRLTAVAIKLLTQVFIIKDIAWGKVYWVL